MFSLSLLFFFSNGIQFSSKISQSSTLKYLHITCSFSLFFQKIKRPKLIYHQWIILVQTWICYSPRVVLILHRTCFINYKLEGIPRYARVIWLYILLLYILIMYFVIISVISNCNFIIPNTIFVLHYTIYVWCEFRNMQNYNRLEKNIVI